MIGVEEDLEPPHAMVVGAVDEVTDRVEVRQGDPKRDKDGEDDDQLHNPDQSERLHPQAVHHEQVPQQRYHHWKAVAVHPRNKMTILINHNLKLIKHSFKAFISSCKVSSWLSRVP